MRIGELAKAADTQVETIRYYEREALLPLAERTDGNYRVYGPEHVERLLFIRYCRGLDMTLGEIRALLRMKDSPPEDCSDINTLIDEHIKHVAVRIRELKALQRQLVELRSSCAGDGSVSECGVLSGMAHASKEAGPALKRATRHVQGAHKFASKEHEPH
jgi:Cd(II)/Pb(II)-responsive transcriptional regulator